MPETKPEKVIFTLMMVFCMVYCMTVYTIAGNMGGLSLPVFGIALREMWVEYVIVFALIFFVITGLAHRLTVRILPQTPAPIFFMLSMQCFTVALIVPTITLAATFLHGGTADWFPRWLTTAVKCFPMALFLQVFYVGPLVRFLFRRIRKCIAAR